MLKFPPKLRDAADKMGSDNLRDMKYDTGCNYCKKKLFLCIRNEQIISYLLCFI